MARAVRSGAGHRQRLRRTPGPPRRTSCGRRRFPGSGNSSPVVWGDRIFLTTAYDGGRRVSVLAYRRSDGRLLWETAAPQGRTDSGAHFKNGHASATPSTDGQRVYVSFGPRGLFALDFAGKIVWQRDLGPIEAYHGAAGSPLLYRDRVILYQDQYRDSFIAAFDTRTGRADLADAPRRQYRVGHADRRSRRRSRRDHRQQPAAGAGVRPGTRP